MTGWVIALVVVAGLGVAGRIGWAHLSKEHREARSLPIQVVDFAELKDGAYRGAYAGGMYQWRANECLVTVASGKVTGVELVRSKDPGGRNTQHQELYDRVIQAQSLRVDTVSGATLTSKAYLKALEDALAHAQPG